MTIRAVLIGAVLGLVIATFGYINDWVFKLPYVASDLMPVSVYGLLVLGLLGINPLLYRLGRRHLSAREWAVILSLTLVACVIPGPGMLWQFNDAMIIPVLAQRQSPGWRVPGSPALLDYVPEIMLVSGAKQLGMPGGEETEEGDDVVRGYRQGLGRPGQFMPLSRVPWRAWAKPMAFYLPLMVLGFVATLCLALIVHRQWCYHEHLRYPMAEVAGELIGGNGDDPFGPIFRRGLFWLGFALALGVLLINGIQTYHPGFIRIPMTADFSPVAQTWPGITKVKDYGSLLLPRFFFVLIGLAFLISSEVSFSLAISHMAYAALFLALTTLGVDMANDHMSGGVLSYQLFGSYVGAGLVILYAGRRYYWAVLKGAFGAAAGEPVERYVTWACRILLLTSAAMIAMLRLLLGLDLVMATLFVMTVGLMFLIVTRINAEAGLLFIQSWWQPVAILTGLFGIQALGPRTIITLGVLSVVLTMDSRVCLMPLAANAFKIADGQRLGLAGLSRWMVVVLVVGVAAAVPFTLYIQYDLGGSQLYDWATTASRMPFEMLKRNVDKLAAWGTLETAGSEDGWGGLARLGQMRPTAKFLWSAGGGLAVILLCSSARLRWTWWPIHPVMFLVWATNVSRWFAASFLLGWLCKVVITRLGGAAAYRKARALFIGMIAGEMVAGILWMAVGALYYAYYGHAGPTFRVHL